MPAQDRVRRHERRDLREQLTTKPVSQYSEPSTVAIVEAQTLPGEPSFQNATRFSSRRNAMTSASSRYVGASHGKAAISN